MKTITAFTLLTAAVATASAAPKSEQPAIDPKAIAALETMGAFLRDQQSFDVELTTATDYVLDTGQKVTLTSNGALRVERPDRLRAELTSNRKQRQFFYDGKTFTIYSPRVGYFATLKAPGSIHELADLLQSKYGLELPLVDLFRWGTEQASLDQITSAAYIGPATIGRVKTKQYAFRQRGLDWQIWIEDGPVPVPRKLVLTTTDDRARPQHEIELTWNLNAKHEASTFAFVPPEDAIGIPLAEVAPSKPDQARRAKRSARR